MSDIWQLAIESSAPTASLVLARGGEVVAERKIEANQNHSAVLIEPLAELVGRLPVGEKLAEVVIATGPGSYNGARVGIAAGQGIALVHDCPAVGVPSLQAVAEVRSGCPCLAVGDARRGSFFGISLREGRVTGDPDLVEAKEFGQMIEAAIEEGIHLFSFEDLKRLALSEEQSEKIAIATPTARLALESWNAMSEADKNHLIRIPPQPFYLRPPHITQPKRKA